jgi:hypothetical protein
VANSSRRRAGDDVGSSAAGPKPGPHQLDTKLARLSRLDGLCRTRPQRYATMIIGVLVYWFTTIRTARKSRVVSNERNDQAYDEHEDIPAESKQHGGNCGPWVLEALK